MNDMTVFAEMAEEMAEMFGELALDYSPESIGPLDELCQIFHETNRTSPLNEETVAVVSNAFGAYVGETLLRNGLGELGFAWMDNGEGETVVGRGGEWMAPITKVYKRITLGPEHDLMSFCDISLSIAKGEIDLEDPRLHILSDEEVEG